MKRPKRYDELTIRDDFMFCKVMENNEDLCRELVERILDMKIEKIYRPGQQKAIRIMPDRRGIRMDVSFVGDDRIYNIEMQNGKKNEIPRRSRYYQSLTDLDSMDQGTSYEEFPDTCIIFICTFDPFDMGLPCYTVKPMIEENTEISYNDGTKKIFLSTAGSDFKGTRPEMKELLAYIKGNSAGDEFTKKLDLAVERARSMERWRKEYMLLEEKYAEFLAEGRETGFEEGREAGLSEGRKEGREEGRKEGREEGYKNGVRDIALRMLTEGESPDRVSKLSGLSVKELESLKSM